MRLCLFQPEIAGNVGAVMRLGACMGVPIDLIEPMGFAWDDKRVRRTAMDYIDHVDVTRHASFDEFRGSRARPADPVHAPRATASPYEFAFQPDDILLFGKESGGVPPEVAAAADAVLRIPIRPEVRSFNLATSAALALGEALRQTGGLPASGRLKFSPAAASIVHRRCVALPAAPAPHGTSRLRRRARRRSPASASISSGMSLTMNAATRTAGMPPSAMPMAILQIDLARSAHGACRPRRSSAPRPSP